MRGFVLVFLALLIFSLPAFFIRADELDDVTKQLETLKEDLKKKEANFSALSKQLEGIKSRVAFLEQEIIKKEQEVRRGEQVLDYQKKLLNARVKSYYKNINKSAFSLFDLLVSENLSQSLQNFFYQKTVVDEDRNAIIKIVLYIKGLEEKRASLVSEKARLAVLKEEIDRQSKVLSGEISGTRQKIAQLSERQQSLIAAKLAALKIPRSAGTSARGCSSDLTNGRDPGFSPRLGFFTYGVPHRNGMNQYGAWGRAKAGQGVEQILSEYYPNLTLKKDYDQNATIVVDGQSYNVEEYVKRIYEMPDSWTDNDAAALKAQAVAARSYGLAHKDGICATESCQVFKPEPKGGNWNSAQEATKGWVLVDGGGNPQSTQYSSTHGGYVLNLSKFDGSGGTPGGFGELNERAYDKDSPWFYCNWGARSEYGGTAWLKTNEVADIANVILLAKRDSSVGEHLYQTDKPNPAGTDTWDAERVKSELRARGGNPFSSASSASVGVDFGGGKTTSVTVSGDAGSETFSGSEFKDWFNLRAPANIQIVGPLYNSEKR
ncbi:hypothetical protein HYT33_04115 [Candidatus Roizmanbacteria bacterium]|nr:hypothetical protein [Candidatus Roizmanbacteria bacterium]